MYVFLFFRDENISVAGKVGIFWCMNKMWNLKSTGYVHRHCSLSEIIFIKIQAAVLCVNIVKKEKVL